MTLASSAGTSQKMGLHDQGPFTAVEADAITAFA
jgi:hypothetical protein